MESLGSVLPPTISTPTGSSGKAVGGRYVRWCWGGVRRRGRGVGGGKVAIQPNILERSALPGRLPELRPRKRQRLNGRETPCVAYGKEGEACGSISSSGHTLFSPTPAPPGRQVCGGAPAGDSPITPHPRTELVRCAIWRRNWPSTCAVAVATLLGAQPPPPTIWTRLLEEPRPFPRHSHRDRCAAVP